MKIYAAPSLSHLNVTIEAQLIEEDMTQSSSFYQPFLLVAVSYYYLHLLFHLRHRLLNLMALRQIPMQKSHSKFLLLVTSQVIFNDSSSIIFS